MSKEDIKNFSEILAEMMNKKGVSREKLAEASGVHINIINDLMKNNFENLPAAPYLHGYIIKICNVLNLNGEKIWQEFFKSEEKIKRSGEKDTLPKSKSVFNLKILVLIFIFVLVFVIFLSFSSYILGKPKLVIDFPDEVVTTTTEKIIFSGTLKNGDKLLFNGQIVSLNEKGEFKEEVVLQPGFNAFVFEASKILGKTVKITKQVYYEKKVELNSDIETIETSTNKSFNVEQ